MKLISSMFNILKKQIELLIKRRKQECAFISCGAIVLAVVILCSFGFSAGGKNTVYAVDSLESSEENSEVLPKTETETEIETEFIQKELQAGLMGIVDGITFMESYSSKAGLKDVSNAGSEILVGASHASKKELNKKAIEKGVRQANDISYYASKLVRDNHMPSEDYYALLRIVEAEATGLDLKSKMLVANVVLNRVKDSHFPNKIYDVVWEKVNGDPQFSPTADGRINSVVITDDTIEAVEKALNGEDYSEGALFFLARSAADGHNVSWFDTSLEKLFEYGGHEFYTYGEVTNGNGQESNDIVQAENYISN